jgi:hypothetical protein
MMLQRYTDIKRGDAIQLEKGLLLFYQITLINLLTILATAI